MILILSDGYNLGYVEDLIFEVDEIRQQYPTYKKAKSCIQALTKDHPDCISSSHPHDSKEQLVAKHISRYNLMAQVIIKQLHYNTALS